MDNNFWISLVLLWLGLGSLTVVSPGVPIFLKVVVGFSYTLLLKLIHLLFWFVLAETFEPLNWS